MKIETLRERIEKKEAQIQKKQNTIAKKSTQIEKRTAKAEAMTDEREKRWELSEIGWLKDDVKRLHDEIEECKATLKKYEAQLAGELEKEATFIKEVPESMKTLEQMLIEKWDENDKERRAFLYRKHSELGYNEFIKKYHYAGWEHMHTDDETFHKKNEKDARFFTLDLLNRVKDVTGEVTDWGGIYLEQGNTFPVLNGRVEGKEGTAIVESILAGGYNIQRLHIRTLVKKF